MTLKKCCHTSNEFSDINYLFVCKMVVCYCHVMYICSIDTQCVYYAYLVCNTLLYTVYSYKCILTVIVTNNSPYGEVLLLLILAYIVHL